MKVEIQLLDNFPGSADPPKTFTDGSVGFDVVNADGPFSLKLGERRLVGTGIKMSFPKGYECQVRPRSGLAHMSGITVLNTPGTIDSDYRGEIKVLLISHREKYITHFAPGERIAQLVFNKVELPEFKIVDSLDITERGEGGFGSTG